MKLQVLPRLLCCGNPWMVCRHAMIQLTDEVPIQKLTENLLEDHYAIPEGRPLHECWEEETLCLYLWSKFENVE